MTIKFIQINIYRGKYLDNLIEFLQKEDPDLISMQEVCNGVLNLYPDKSADLFLMIKQRLAMEGVFNGDLKVIDRQESSLGNAVFSKLAIVKSKVVILKNFRPITEDEFTDSKLWPDFSRQILDVLINVDGRIVHIISIHGAWTAPPIDTDEKLRQAQIILDYLGDLNKNNQPFIVGADLNMPPETGVIQMINSVAQNLMINSPFKYTTHPKIHKIVPTKLLVDYIFTSKHFKLLSLKVPQVTVSDHLPVIAQLELLS